MALNPRHDKIVKYGAVIAAIIGLLFGWAQGADLGFLFVLWFFCILLIVATADAQPKLIFLFKLLLALFIAFLILVSAIEVATLISTAFFWIVNPFLNYIVTYRILRVTSKLLIKRDAEEGVSGVFSILLRVFKFILTGDDDDHLV